MQKPRGEKKTRDQQMKKKHRGGKKNMKMAMKICGVRSTAARTRIVDIGVKSRILNLFRCFHY